MNVLEEYLIIVRENCKVNSKLIGYLKELEDYIDLNDITALQKLEVARCLSEGFIIYSKKELIKDLSVSKTALVYLVNKLKEEDKLIYKVIDNVTLIKLK